MRGAAQRFSQYRGRVWLVVSVPTPEGSVDDLIRLITEQGFRTAGIEDFRGVGVAMFVRAGGKR